MVNKRRSVLQTLKDEKELKELNEKLQHYYSDCKKLQALAGIGFFLRCCCIFSFNERFVKLQIFRTGASRSQCWRKFHSASWRRTGGGRIAQSSDYGSATVCSSQVRRLWNFIYLFSTFWRAWCWLLVSSFFFVCFPNFVLCLFHCLFCEHFIPSKNISTDRDHSLYCSIG